jgi:hypothetical protein
MAKASRDAAAGPTVETLLRRVRRLEAALQAEGERHARQLKSVRSAANRKLACMMQEIATLRHHEARAEALARLLADQHTGTPKRQHDGEDSRLPG